MSITNNPFISGTPVTASDVKSRLQDAEDWVNGGIAKTDTQGSGQWVRKKHIYGPDFYGAPTPRAVMTTGETHWRLTPNDESRAELFHEEMRGADAGDEWVPVEGLNATIKLTEAANVVVLASWWVWETGNKSPFYLSLHNFEKTGAEQAYFQLQHVKHTSDGSVPSVTTVDGTTQAVLRSHRIYNAGWTRAGAKQMVCHHTIDALSAGIHTIGIRCRSEPQIGGNIIIRNRHLIVDIYGRP